MLIPTFTFIDTIKYIGLAIFIFFLLKAMAGEILSNCQILIIVLCIMILVLIIVAQTLDCARQKKHKLEKFTNDVDEVSSNNIIPTTFDDDVNNASESDTIPTTFNDNIDTKDKLKMLISRENEAKSRIRKGYSGEMKYTRSHPFNTMPLGSQIYGYSYLPPENWFRPYEMYQLNISCDDDVKPSNQTYNLLEIDQQDPRTIDITYIQETYNKNIKN